MTFQEMLTEFYARGFDYLNDSGPGEVRAKRWLNQGYMDIIEADDWPFLYAETGGSAPLTISDLGTIESVWSATSKTNVAHADRRTLVEAYGDLSTTGTPQFFYFTSPSTIATYPVSTDGLTVRYWRVPSELSAGSDTPVFPSRYHYAIVDHAVGRAYMDSDNPEMAQAARADADSLVNAMRQRLLYQQHQDADQVVAYGYSTDYYVR